MNSNIPGVLARRAAGVTLVELMVVLLIVAMLAAIAYPGYRSHVVKTQRAAAKGCLLQYAALMERYYTTQLTYIDADDLAVPGCASEGNMPLNYTFSLAGLSATAYTARAVPTTAFAARDTQCGTLTLNQAGVRGVSSGTLTDCW
jgi:type IV pilus assembly protein PilE